MRALSRVIVSLVAAVGSTVGCSNGGGTSERALATLEAFDDGLALPAGGVVGVSLASLAVGEEGVVSELKLIDTGSGDLRVSAIEIVSEPPGAFRLAGDADGAAMPAFPVTVAPINDLAGQRSLFFYLLATRPAAGSTPRATIRVASNSISSNGDTQAVISYDVRVQSAAAAIQVTPTSVDFGAVSQDESRLESINILNPGAETLVIDKFGLSGHPNFELVVGSTRYPVTAESAAGGTRLPEPITVEPGMSVAVSVRYTATDDSQARGNVVLYSNAPGAPDGTTVSLQANVGGPCIAVNPRKVAFGGKLVGKLATIDVAITSCGTQPLELREIGLVAGGSERFSLSLAALPGVTGAATALGPADAPLVIAPSQTATLTVQYFPDAESPMGDDGEPVFDLGTLRIRSNSFQPELLVELSGLGVLIECPQAVIIIQEGEEVIPQTTLHLIGSQSTTAIGPVAVYQWEVDQPGSVQSVFTPSTAVANPTFEVNAAGHYTFRLTVIDAAGVASCVPATAEVFVNPNEAIHAELLWNTPGDPFPNDEVGADLDLHFMHPNAAGVYDGDGDGEPDDWFDNPFDCFWNNPHPNWASADNNVNDNPGLDRDDTDGLGPENLNLDLPEDGLTYRVGVNYWDDAGFGTSTATVRIYIYGNPVFEVSGVELFKHDMWWVTEITWPPAGTNPEVINVCGGTTDTCTSDAQCGAGRCGLRITPNYQNPQYFQP